MKAKRKFAGVVAVLAAVAASLVIAGDAAAQTESVLHSFGNTGDGYWPYGNLISDASGNLFGTASQTNGVKCDGVVFCYGMVYELSPAVGGWTETILHYFAGYADGGNPMAGLIMDKAGNIYGTTREGGASNDTNPGAVFELSPSSDGTWTEKILWSFYSAPYDGVNPTTNLVIDPAGNLYGTTEYGGSGGGGDLGVGCGVGFELSPSSGGSWNEKTIHTFTLNDGDGICPLAGLAMDAVGNLYGTTSGGGNAGYGTVFELMPSTGGKWREKILHRFSNNGKDGYSPTAGVVLDAAGNVYGVTPQGGLFGRQDAFSGTAFELSPSKDGGWSEKIIHNFGNFQGDSPSAGLVFDASGNLYGVTFAYQFNIGGVYELSPGGVGGSWTHKILYTFGPSYGGGYNPAGSLMLDSSGNLYGTTVWGGVYGAVPQDGTVYEVTP
jgi:uncharacterized repeat protein (TIGR03803 family)